MSLFGANREEAEELYELAWELSQNKGPTAFYYDQLVQEAFDNSRTVLEQAVANEGYEWQQGDRVLDSTIKRLFLADLTTDQAIASQISHIRRLLLKIYLKKQKMKVVVIILHQKDGIMMERLDLLMMEDYTHIQKD
jgi:hypothetical protein